MFYVAYPKFMKFQGKNTFKKNKILFEQFGFSFFKHFDNLG